MIFYKRYKTNYLHFNQKNYRLLTSKRHKHITLDNDVLFSDISRLTACNLPRNILMTCEGKNHVQYQYLDYIHLLRSGDKLSVVVDVNYSLQEWKENINLLSFVEKIRRRLLDLYTIESKQKNIFDEALINVCFELIAECGTSIESMIKLLDTLLYQEHKNILSYKTIRYKISLSRRHQQAGKSLLHYLYRVMEYKNLSDDLTVSVNENARLVTLELKFPVDKQEKIKKAIHHYGLILKGDLSVRHLFKEKGQRRDLSASLTAIQKRISIQNEKIYASDKKFHSSEEETAWLRFHIGECLANETLIVA